MSPCSFVRVAIDSCSCNSYEWSIHIDLYESKLTGKLVAIFIIMRIISRGARYIILRACSGLRDRTFALYHLLVCPSLGLSVDLFVCIWYPGKMAEWIRMPLGMLGGVRLCIGVLDFGDDHRRGRGT